MEGMMEGMKIGESEQITNRSEHASLENETMLEQSQQSDFCSMMFKTFARRYETMGWDICLAANKMV